MGNTIHNIHAKASLPCVHLPVIAIAGGKGVTYWPDDVPEAIRKSCVLWYDPARQGCTNESMAENPVLRDLSGNGHYATCYNFAWSGMSGIGGYAIDFNNWYSQSNTAWKITNKTYKTLIFKCISASIKELTFINHGKFEKKNFSIQITSNNPELKFELISVFNNNTSNKIQQNEDGVIQTDYSDEEFNTIGDVYPTLCITADTFSFLKEDDIITIEQLPLYPNSLVSDGVDDYCLVEGLPLLNKEDGYTVIAKRKWLETPTETTALASKRDIDNSLSGAFQFEYCTQGRHLLINFGLDTDIEYVQQDISWMTSQQYNNTSIRIGIGEDTDIMYILTSMAKSYRAKMALYSLLLFNRDLTQDEIEWVKTNILGEANQ